jgi:hypothetical protein
MEGFSRMPPCVGSLPASAATATPAAATAAIHALLLFRASEGFQFANGFLGFGLTHGNISFSGIVLKLAGTIPTVLPADGPGRQQTFKVWLIAVLPWPSPYRWRFRREM